jgi:predicted metal-dependent hydrolase
MEDKPIRYDICYRDIKNPRLEFRGGKLRAVVPFGYDASVLVEKYRSWIIKKTGKIENSLKDAQALELSRRTYGQFIRLVGSLSERLAEKAGWQIEEIKFRKMKTRWASIRFASRASIINTRPQGPITITFNRNMQNLPEHLIEYIVFHEILHLFEKKHSKKFREIVKNRYKDFKQIEKDLSAYWMKISGTRYI